MVKSQVQLALGVGNAEIECHYYCIKKYYDLSVLVKTCGTDQKTDAEVDKFHWVYYKSIIHHGEHDDAALISFLSRMWDKILFLLL